MADQLCEPFIISVTENNQAGVQECLETAAAEDSATLLALLETEITPGRWPVLFAADQAHASLVKHLLAAADSLKPGQDAHSNLRQLKFHAKYPAAEWTQELQQLVQQRTQCCIDIMCASTAAGGSCSPLFAAARRGDVAHLQQLLADGGTDSLVDSSTQPDWLDEDYWASTPRSALAAAAAATTTPAAAAANDEQQQGSLAALQLLIGAASHAQLAGEYGCTALLTAIECDVAPEVVQLLLGAVQRSEAKAWWCWRLHLRLLPAA